MRSEELPTVGAGLLGAFDPPTANRHVLSVLFMSARAIHPVVGLPVRIRHQFKLGQAAIVITVGGEHG
jgi:hypothetical protein